MNRYIIYIYVGYNTIIKHECDELEQARELVSIILGKQVEEIELNKKYHLNKLVKLTIYNLYTNQEIENYVKEICQLCGKGIPYCTCYVGSNPEF